MFSVNATDDIFEKFKEMLEDEGEDGGIRLREFKVGQACKSKLVPGLSVDDEFDDVEDIRVEIHGIPFFAEKYFVERYGDSYDVIIDPQKGPVLTPTNKP